MLRLVDAKGLPVTSRAHLRASARNRGDLSSRKVHSTNCVIFRVGHIECISPDRCALWRVEGATDPVDEPCSAGPAGHLDCGNLGILPEPRDEDPVVSAVRYDDSVLMNENLSGIPQSAWLRGRLIYFEMQMLFVQEAA